MINTNSDLKSPELADFFKANNCRLLIKGDGKEFGKEGNFGQIIIAGGNLFFNPNESLEKTDRLLKQSEFKQDTISFLFKIARDQNQ